MSCYKSGKFNNDYGLLGGWRVNDNKSDKNNEDKVYLLLKR